MINIYYPVAGGYVGIFPVEGMNCILGYAVTLHLYRYCECGRALEDEKRSVMNPGCSLFKSEEEAKEVVKKSFEQHELDSFANDSEEMFADEIEAEINRLNELAEKCKFDVRYSEDDFIIWHFDTENDFCETDNEYYSYSLLVRSVYEITLKVEMVVIHDPATDMYQEPKHLTLNGNSPIRLNIPDYVIDQSGDTDFETAVWAHGKLMFASVAEIETGDPVDYLKYADWSAEELITLLR